MIMRKVAIFIPDFRVGGAERVSINLANELVSRGFPVDLVVMRLQGSLTAEIDSRIQIVALDTPRPRHVLLPLVRYLRWARPGALLAVMWPLTALSVLARSVSRVRCRLVVAEHTTWSFSRLAQRPRTRRFIVHTMRWLLPRADAIVSVSDGASRDLEAFAGLAPGSVLTVYNPVSGHTHGSSPLRAHLAGWASGPHRRLLAVGTLKPQKDYPTLLRAMAELSDVDLQLLILGEGEERSNLETMVMELGLQHRVLMPGFVADTPPVYASADLFVLSSVNEGLPTVLIEALEHGVPVVSTDCPSGPREILEDGRHGTLVPTGDSCALSSAIRDALSRNHDHEALRIRAQDFSIGKAADAYLGLLLPDEQMPEQDEA